uniref:Ig-like domain-containing protein n=1 Tax=Oncorhynchus tshawytscha TaxID=74940 RepID=A0AAZ3QUY8_ONCTS
MIDFSNFSYCELIFLPLGTFSQPWSMTVPPVVNSTIGGDVVLPCSFTHPKQQDYSKGITVQWITRQFHDTPFFQCKVKNVTTGGMNECSVPESYQRFSVKGDPKQRDLSLLIRDLTVTDNGVYFCRVELDYYWGDGKWQTASGTQLNIIAKAQILSLSWVEASLGPGNGSLRCVVEGNPPSTITWFSSSKGNIDPGVSTIGTHPFQWTSSIPYFTQEVYTCRAENSLGRAERRFPPGPTALTVALSVCGVLLLLLLLGVALFYLRKRGRAECELKASLSGRLFSTFLSFSRRSIQSDLQEQLGLSALLKDTSADVSPSLLRDWNWPNTLNPLDYLLPCYSLSPHICFPMY